MGIFPKRTLATEEAVVFLHEKALVQYKQHKIYHSHFLGKSDQSIRKD